MAFTNNYVVGKGRLYFDRFALGTRTPTGLKYFGNTPSLTTSRNATTLDHFDSDGGVKQKDDSIDIQTDLGGKFACDNINSANLALFFGGDVTPLTQAAGANALTEVINVKPDTYYQAGVTDTDPDGLRTLAAPTAVLAQTPLVLGVDYDFDLSSGMVYIHPTAAVGQGGPLTLGYNLAAAAQEVVIEQGSAIYGQLKFVSNNPKGDQRDYFYPYVKLTAGGDLTLKGDQWQQVDFSYEALKLNEQTRRVYVTRRPL